MQLQDHLCCGFLTALGAEWGIYVFRDAGDREVHTYSISLYENQ